jgi:hypothetical protein
LQAANNPPMQSQNQAQAKDLPPVSAAPVSIADAVHASSVPPSASAPPLEASLAPNDLHVQVTEPFVFHATGSPPPPLADVYALPVDSRPRTAPALATPLPPSTPPNSGTGTASVNHAPERGFFKKIGGFFAALFR